MRSLDLALKTVRKCEYRSLFTLNITLAETKCRVDQTLRSYARSFQYAESKEAVFAMYRFVGKRLPPGPGVQGLDAVQVFLPGAKAKTKRVAEEPADCRPLVGNVKRLKHLQN